MRFLVLGSLDVVDGGVLPPRAAKHKNLLAILLINANQVVSLERLIDTLWPEAPRTAENLVRQYISHLRKLLVCERDGGVELRTHNAGYQLTIPPQSTDAQEFEDLVRQARDDLDSDQPILARKEVARALELWRGRAFADVPWSTEIAAERARLEEMRINAHELWAEASLAAGEFGDAVSELTGLTIRYPLREHLHGQLMRALSASGRKADALGVYRSARNNLIAELGLEPGQELRDIERSILNNEPVPAVEAPLMAPAGDRQAAVGQPLDATTTDERPLLTPPQLPPALIDFVGRRDHLHAIRGCLVRPSGRNQGSQLPTAPPIVVLHGLRGAGKTALALQAAHELQHDFQDGQLFVGLRGSHDEVIDTSDALRQMLEMLGYPPDAVPTGLLARQQLYRRMMTDRRILVILDDAVDEVQVGQLLPGRSAGAAVLVTSRARLSAFDGARQILVPMFTEAEATDLLASVVGHDRVVAEPDAARALGDECERLPCAVRAVATVLSTLPHRSLRYMVGRLDGERIFTELTAGEHDLLRLVGDCYAELGRDEQQWLCRMAKNPDVPGAHRSGAVLTESDLRAPDHLVDRLVDAGVLEVAGADRHGATLFRCAGLLLRYARLATGRC